VTLARTPQQAGIVIPDYTPLPAHLPFTLYTISERILYVSGHIPDVDGELPIRGRLGEEIDSDAGRVAARRVALNLLATLLHAAGDLNNIRRILKLTGFVASADGFVDQPDVINAASEVFVDLWGEAGIHARSAIGVAQLPLGVPVEIELVVELEDPHET